MALATKPHVADQGRMQQHKVRGVTLAWILVTLARFVERPSAVGFYLCAQAHHTEDVALARSLWCLRMTSELLTYTP